MRLLVAMLLFPSLAAAAQCRPLGDETGLPVVFILHRASETDAAAALDALKGSPYGVAGIAGRVARVPDDACERATQDSLVPFLRCTSAVNEALAACGLSVSKVVVLSSLSFTSRAQLSNPNETAGVFVSTAAGPSDWIRELLHELGHTFGLRDERASLAAKEGSPAKQPGPNCAKNEAEARRRWGDLLAREQAGLHRGCAGHAGWLRPHERTIMGTPRATADFGASNERYLKDAIRCCFTDRRQGCVEAAASHPELASCQER